MKRVSAVLLLALACIVADAQGLRPGAGIGTALQGAGQGLNQGLNGLGQGINGVGHGLGQGLKWRHGGAICAAGFGKPPGCKMNAGRMKETARTGRRFPEYAAYVRDGKPETRLPDRNRDRISKRVCGTVIMKKYMALFAPESSLGFTLGNQVRERHGCINPHPNPPPISGAGDDS